jgi:DNA-binding NtrC family response regulator
VHVRALVRDILQSNGYRVIVASDPADAIATSQTHPAIDLLLTDVVMPKMSGRELATRVMAARPKIRVLFMSGYADIALAPNALLAESFIAKPFTPEALLKRVRSILER